MTPEEQLDAITLSVLENAGPDIVEDIRAELSAPYPPASDPGQAPHKRSGELAEGISYIVRQSGSVTTLEVASEAPHSEWLERGTKAMGARPSMGPALEKWGPIVRDRLEGAVNG